MNIPYSYYDVGWKFTAGISLRYSASYNTNLIFLKASQTEKKTTILSIYVYGSQRFHIYLNVSIEFDLE